jgi:hypothetical protein
MLLAALAGGSQILVVPHGIPRGTLRGAPWDTRVGGGGGSPRGPPGAPPRGTPGGHLSGHLGARYGCLFGGLWSGDNSGGHIKMIGIPDEIISGGGRSQPPPMLGGAARGRPPKNNFFYMTAELSQNRLRKRPPYHAPECPLGCTVGVPRVFPWSAPAGSVGGTFGDPPGRSLGVPWGGTPGIPRGGRVRWGSSMKHPCGTCTR